MKKKYKRGYTAGVFDLFHKGHLNILRKAKESCSTLIVAVTTDELCKNRKGYYPVINYANRCLAINETGFVDQIVAQENMDKYSACISLNVDVIFVGDDWKGTEYWNKLEAQLNKLNIDVVYLKRTPNVSSSCLHKTCEGLQLRYYTVLSGYSIVRYTGNAKKITIPDTLGIYPIVRIEDQAFALCEAEQITIGKRIISIGNEAFYCCTNLESITLPDTLRYIGGASFYNCANLKSIKIPEYIQFLPSYLFIGCTQLENLTFSKNLYRICQNAIDVQSPCVTKKNGVYIINNWILGSYSKFSDISFPEGCLGVADAAFMGNRTISNIHIPDSLEYIGAFAFDGSLLWETSYEGEVIYADRWAIGVVDSTLSVSQISLRDGTVGIGDMAFACCRYLKIVSGIESVKYIGRDAFKGCPRIEVKSANQ